MRILFTTTIDGKPQWKMQTGNSMWVIQSEVMSLFNISADALRMYLSRHNIKTINSVDAIPKVLIPLDAFLQYLSRKYKKPAEAEEVKLL